MPSTRLAGHACVRPWLLVLIFFCQFLGELGLAEHNLGCFDGEWFGSGETFTSVNPTTNTAVATVRGGNLADWQRVLKSTKAAEAVWQRVPAPKRGEVVRQIGNALREKLDPLGRLVSLEVGKSLPEGVGEVQEYVDICDFACGLSRSLEGKGEPSAVCHDESVLTPGSAWFCSSVSFL